MTANNENLPLSAEPSAYQWPVMGVGSGALFASVLSGDCLQVMATLEAGSIDAIITDLPYGTTACKWDAVIPFAPLWEQVRRALKPNGVFVTTASQPFTSALVMSNPTQFKHEWIWEKSKASNFLLARKQPLKAHESIVVFSPGTPAYYPQKTVGKPFKGAGRSKKGSQTELVNTVPTPTFRNDNNGDRFPRSVQYFVTAESEGCMHPTQKPLELMRYLVRTYTNPGDTVLDPCCGSGTTGVAAQAEGRNCVLIEREEKYLEITRQRLLANIQRSETGEARSL